MKRWMTAMALFGMAVVETAAARPETAALAVPTGASVRSDPGARLAAPVAAPKRLPILR